MTESLWVVIEDIIMVTSKGELALEEYRKEWCDHKFKVDSILMNEVENNEKN